MKKLMTEWRQYIAEREDATRSRAGTGVAPAESEAISARNRLIAFGKNLKPEQYRHILQQVKRMLPAPVIHRQILNALMAGMKGNPTPQQALKFNKILYTASNVGELFEKAGYFADLPVAEWPSGE